MRTRRLTLLGNDEQHLLEAVARARGCSTPEQTAAFLDPDPEIPNPLHRLDGYAAARERIAQSILMGERILVFGDYDCDGITSVVQMVDFLRAVRHPSVCWFVPDRTAHDYGLTVHAADEAVERHDPGLVLAVDCGSASIGTIGMLRSRGIDCIVLDHHTVPPLDGPHPALAHLNPKACTSDDPDLLDLRRMSASGLAFLFSELLARDFRAGAWDRERALVLAGLGTVVDVMPLLGTNRALVKHALRLANDPGVLGRIPGLAALHELIRTDRVDVGTFGFHWGPRLNATGRIGSSYPSVELLLAHDPGEARTLAAVCDEANRERRRMQQSAEELAMTMAEERLGQDPPDSVLLLWDRSWHPGIVGTVANRVKDAFSRPAIVCGWHDEGYWKGSGRSPDAFDLGAAVQEAVSSGLLLGGGGHRLAAGIRLAPEQAESFRSWLQTRCTLDPSDLQEEREVLAEVRLLDHQDQKEMAQAWCGILNRLEPFGAGNPAPGLYLANAELRWGPAAKKRRSDGAVWALSAGFGWPGSGYLFADWTDVRRATSEWVPGERFDLVLQVSSRRGNDRRTGQAATWYDWTVTDCMKTNPGSATG